MPIAAFAFHLSGARLNLAVADQHNQNNINNPRLIKMLWLTYWLAVTAGLMTIGHTTAIAEKGSVSIELIVIAPIIVVFFNIGGSLLDG